MEEVAIPVAMETKSTSDSNEMDKNVKYYGCVDISIGLLIRGIDKCAIAYNIPGC
jgi:hypothetical protein